MVTSSLSIKFDVKFRVVTSLQRRSCRAVNSDVCSKIRCQSAVIRAFRVALFVCTSHFISIPNKGLVPTPLLILAFNFPTKSLSIGVFNVNACLPEADTALFRLPIAKDSIKFTGTDVYSCVSVATVFLSLL